MAKKRRSWTAADVRELKSAARKKTPAGRIAKTLKRTEGATRQKAFSLGLSLRFASLKSGTRVCCGNPQLRYRSKPRLVRGFLASAWDIAARPYFTAYVTKRFRPNGEPIFGGSKWIDLLFIVLGITAALRLAAGRNWGRCPNRFGLRNDNDPREHDASQTPVG